jgi:hypothetical protein
MYPLDAAKCLSNCDAEVLDDICSAEIDFILSTIPELAKLFLIHDHITEKIWIPLIFVEHQALGIAAQAKKTKELKANKERCG